MTPPDHSDVLIVGAGHGGAQMALALRQARFEGTITILGDEPHLPYERPALSKQYLAGERAFDDILISPAEAWRSRNVTLRLGNRVTALDPAAHTATTEDGTTHPYGSLVWSTGGQPRRMTCPGADLAGIHTVRGRADVDRLVSELPTTGHVAIVGGGYIGLEAAAVLAKRGLKVTILEAQDRLLARVAGPALSNFFADLHRRHDVDIRLNAAVEEILGRDGRAHALRLADGEILEADLVIVGIGIVPLVQPLLDAGATGGNGVEVDPQCRTSLPDIFAIGDCALHPNPHADFRKIRLESVQNATDMARHVAALLTGKPETDYAQIPWFWSNQYDVTLQTIGLSTGHDREITRGDPTSNKFSVVYLRDNRVIALDCVNAGKDYVQGRALIANHTRPDLDDLADPTIPLKQVRGSAPVPAGG